MTKKIIQYEDSIWHDDTITGCKTLGEVLETVQNLIQSFGEGTGIDFDSGYNSINESLYVTKEREETDSEYQYRMKKEKKQADKERQEYERLKAKFAKEGDNV